MTGAVSNWEESWHSLRLPHHILGERRRGRHNFNRDDLNPFAPSSKFLNPHFDNRKNGRRELREYLVRMPHAECLANACDRTLRRLPVCLENPLHTRLQPIAVVALACTHTPAQSIETRLGLTHAGTGTYG